MPDCSPAWRDAAADDLVDERGVHAVPVEQAALGAGEQLHGVEAGQGLAAAAVGRASGVDDDGGRHGGGSQDGSDGRDSRTLIARPAAGPEIPAQRNPPAGQAAGGNSTTATSAASSVARATGSSRSPASSKDTRLPVGSMRSPCASEPVRSTTYPACVGSPSSRSSSPAPRRTPYARAPRAGAGQLDEPGPRAEALVEGDGEVLAATRHPAPLLPLLGHVVEARGRVAAQGQVGDADRRVGADRPVRREGVGVVHDARSGGVPADRARAADDDLELVDLVEVRAQLRRLLLDEVGLLPGATAVWLPR